VDEWVRQQEAISEAALQEQSGVDSATMTAILRHAEVLPDAAAPLSARQILLLRSLFRGEATSHE
jgi:hypothetical protein